MSDTKWTPGPWALVSVNKVFLDYRIKSLHQKEVATVKGRRSFDEEKANAHLIAAAPELYEALEAAKRIILQSNAPYQDEVLSQIEVAQSKARGET